MTFVDSRLYPGQTEEGDELRESLLAMGLRLVRQVVICIRNKFLTSVITKYRSTRIVAFRHQLNKFICKFVESRNVTNNAEKER